MWRKENVNERSRVVFTGGELYSALNRLKFSLIFRPYKKSYRVVITRSPEPLSIYIPDTVFRCAGLRSQPLLISDLADPPSLFIHSSTEFLHRERVLFCARYVLVRLACRQSRMYVHNACSVNGSAAVDARRYTLFL